MTIFGAIPSEVQIFDLYFPPLFIAMGLGFIFARLTKKLLNQSGLSRYFWHPPLADAALWLMATALISFFIIAP